MATTGRDVPTVGASTDDEDSVIEERALYQDLVDAQPGGIYRLRVRPPELLTTESWRSAVDTSFSFDFVSERFAEILGSTRGELQRNPGIVPDVVVEDDRPGFLARNLEAFTSRAPFQWTGRMTIRGETRWIRFSSRQRLLANGDVIRTGFVEDVTEAMRAQQALVAAEERFRTFFDLSSIGKAMTAPDGRLVRVNKSLCDMLGYSAEELQSRTFAAVTHPDDVPESVELIRSLLAGDRGVVDVEKRYLTRAGRVVWAHVRVCLLRDAAGTPLHLITDIVDITDRKATEESLRVANDRLRRSEYLLNEMGRMAKVGGWELDLLANRLEWTEGTRRIHEVRPEFVPTVDEAIGFYHPEDRPKIASAVRLAVELGQPFDLELRLITSRGRELWVEAIGKADLQDGRVIRVAGTFQDITERKRAEEALRRSDERFELAVHGASDGIWDRNLLTDEEHFSGRFCEIFGYRQDEIEPRFAAFERLIHPEDRERVITRLRRHLEGREPYDTEYRILTKDGCIRWVHSRGQAIWDESGKPTRMAGAITDITDRKQVEEAFRVSEEKFRNLFNNAEVGMFRTRLDGSEILDMNKKYLEIFGLDREEMQGTPSAIRWADPREREAMVERLVATGRVVEMECRMLNRAGEVRTCLTSLQLYRDEGILEGSITDVTERRRAEEEVHRLNAELEQRVKERTAQLETSNKELEAFAYSVSHDLRAPLRAIDAFSAKVVEKHGDEVGSEAQRLLGVVRANARRMADLIDDLLVLSRMGRSEMKYRRLNMRGMARSTFEEVVPDPERRARIEFHVEDLPEVDGDAALLRQVWINLLSNAVKFSAGKETPVLKVEGSVDGDRAVYRVRDNGAGFDMAYAGKLFGVFQRLHGINEFEGTGIGLALVKRIVARHGGQVDAEGEVGKGATFSFSLPTRPTTR